MVDSFGELEASSLFCVRCKQATPVRKKLLLVLPSGNKYDYTCSVCGTHVGGKTDSNSSDFHRVEAPVTLFAAIETEHHQAQREIASSSAAPSPTLSARPSANTSPSAR